MKANHYIEVTEVLHQLDKTGLANDFDSFRKTTTGEGKRTRTRTSTTTTNTTTTTTTTTTT
eukprot:9500407-Heterocapsa_arctica.AAC.1